MKRVGSIRSAVGVGLLISMSGASQPATAQLGMDFCDAIAVGVCAQDGDTPDGLGWQAMGYASYEQCYDQQLDVCRGNEGGSSGGGGPPGGIPPGAVSCANLSDQQRQQDPFCQHFN